MKRALLFLLGAAIFAAIFAGAIWYGLFAHQSPAGQPPLAPMELDTFRAEFNAAKDRTRLILLLSPT